MAKNARRKSLTKALLATVLVLPAMSFGVALGVVMSRWASLDDGRFWLIAGLFALITCVVVLEGRRRGVRVISGRGDVILVVGSVVTGAFGGPNLFPAFDAPAHPAWAIALVATAAFTCLTTVITSAAPSVTDDGAQRRLEAERDRLAHENDRLRLANAILKTVNNLVVENSGLEADNADLRRRLAGYVSSASPESSGQG